MNDLKKELRAKARQFIAAQSAQKRVEYGGKMADILFISPIWERAKSVFCFYSLPTECDTGKILSTALSQSKILCLPKCEENGVMHAYRVSNLNDMRTGAYNIPEPAGEEIVPLSDIDLCILPCYAASPDGSRLGKGGGYYDRFLSEFKGTTVVMCQDELVLQNGTIPMDNHDVYAGYILTQTKLTEAKK